MYVCMYVSLRPLAGDCQLALLKFEDAESKTVFSHSSAHILGAAIEASKHIHAYIHTYICTYIAYICMFNCCNHQNQHTHFYLYIFIYTLKFYEYIHIYIYIHTCLLIIYRQPSGRTSRLAHPCNQVRHNGIVTLVLHHRV